MLILRRASKFRDIAEIEPISGDIRLVNAENQDVRTREIHGLWETLGAIFVCVYLWEGSLILRINTESMSLAEAVVQFERDTPDRKLVVTDRSGRQLEIEYPAPRDPSDVSEWPVDVQDYDFGAWISWVANDPARQAHLKLTWQNQESFDRT